MKSKYEKLKQIYNDLKSKVDLRSSNRILTKQANSAKTLYNNIIKLAEIDPSIENKTILEKASNVFKVIQKLVEHKRLSERVSFKGAVTAIIITNRLKQKIKMTSILEIIKTASMLVPEYDGNSENLNRVVSAITALKTLTDANNKAAAIQVVLSKLSGKTRSAVGDNPPELDTIIDGLKTRCAVTCQPEVILAKLANERQTSELLKFTEQVEKLTVQLESAYIAENVPIATASRLAVRAGTNALANGLRNKESQLIIKAGKFDTLAEAIGKANENEKNTTSNSVLFCNSNSHSHVRGGQRGRNARDLTPRGGYANPGRHNTNQGNYYPSRGRGGYGYRNGFGNRGGNNFRGRNFHQQNRVFYAQAENMHVPQQVNVGGMASMMGNPGQLAQQPNQAPLQNQQVALANIVRR